MSLDQAMEHVCYGDGNRHAKRHNEAQRYRIAVQAGPVQPEADAFGDERVAQIHAVAHRAYEPQRLQPPPMFHFLVEPIQE